MRQKIFFYSLATIIRRAPHAPTTDPGIPVIETTEKEPAPISTESPVVAELANAWFLWISLRESITRPFRARHDSSAREGASNFIFPKIVNGLDAAATE